MTAQTLELITEDHRPWARIADDYLIRRIKTRRPFSAFDLEKDGCPPPANPSAWGAFFGNAARKRQIRRYGIKPSDRPRGRSTIVCLWIDPKSRYQ